LVVEDNLLNQLIIKRCLGIFKMNYKVVDEGNKALELFIAQSFDFVLLDINIPGIDGYEIAKRIRRLTAEEFKNVPIIAVTASDVIELIEKMKSAGINDCLQKPYTQESLYNILLKHLVQ
jgi:CheY-like chemotaxis protein